MKIFFLLLATLTAHAEPNVREGENPQAPVTKRMRVFLSNTVLQSRSYVAPTPPACPHPPRCPMLLLPEPAPVQPHTDVTLAWYDNLYLVGRAHEFYLWKDPGFQIAPILAFAEQNGGWLDVDVEITSSVYGQTITAEENRSGGETLCTRFLHQEAKLTFVDTVAKGLNGLASSAHEELPPQPGACLSQ